MYSPLLLLTLPLFYSTQGNPVNRESPFKEPITVTSNGINVTYDVVTFPESYITPQYHPYGCEVIGQKLTSIPDFIHQGILASRLRNGNFLIGLEESQPGQFKWQNEEKAPYLNVLPSNITTFPRYYTFIQKSEDKEDIGKWKVFGEPGNDHVHSFLCTPTL